MLWVGFRMAIDLYVVEVHALLQKDGGQSVNQTT